MIEMTNTPLEVVSKNYEEERFAPAADVTAGELVQIGASAGYGIALVGVLAGVTGAFITKAERIIGVKDAAAIAVGAKVYYTVATNVLSATGGSGTIEIGYCQQAAGASDGTVYTTFDGYGKVETP